MAASERALYTARVTFPGLFLTLALLVLLVPAPADARDAREAVQALGLVKPNPVQAAKPFEVETSLLTIVE